MAKTLTQKQIDAKLATLPGWKVNAQYSKISCTLVTKDFVAGLALLTRIAVQAEMLNHHPDVTLSYSSVKVTLSTHDAGGLTELDFKLAKRIADLS